MITQNPIIGNAKKKIGNVYARTMYGKNIIQSCPTFTKNNVSPKNRKQRECFGKIVMLANIERASILNNIFYNSPIGRNRRQEWTKQLLTARQKNGEDYIIDASMINQLGGNITSTTAMLAITPTTDTITIAKSETQPTSAAITTETPLIYIIEPTIPTLINCNSISSIEENNIIIENIPENIINKECFLVALWPVNMGTTTHPIFKYGSYLRLSQHE